MKETAVDFLMGKLFDPSTMVAEQMQWFEQAKEMEKEQMGYSKEDVLKAGEMGEINHIDTKHIVLMVFYAIKSAQSIGAKYIYLTADNQILGYKEELSVIEVYNVNADLVLTL